ncbi:MAG: SGNH/GDSL hydrolase family protein [Candidatus Aureabacteria bacterium]|nr:SGNH/GDSL hydrolase family protein [Candidatus Auribacterota bacterium]
MRRILLAIVYSLLLSPSGTAFSQPDFSAFVTFGDSLTHNDLLGIAYDNPQDLYGEDPAEAVFSKGALPDDTLNSYAIGGSQAKDISRQIDVYELCERIGTQLRATLINFQIGGNDILNNFDELAAHAPGTDSAADGIIDTLLATMKEDMLRLYDAHQDARFIVWTIPDVTIAPKHYGALTGAEMGNVRAHIDEVNRFIRSLDQYSFVVVLDLYRLFQQIVATPPSGNGHQLVPPPAYGDYDNMFADEIHPTAVSNAMVANTIINQMNKKWKGAIPRYSAPELIHLAGISD